MKTGSKTCHIGKDNNIEVDVDFSYMEREKGDLENPPADAECIIESVTLKNEVSNIIDNLDMETIHRFQAECIEYMETKGSEYD